MTIDLEDGGSVEVTFELKAGQVILSFQAADDAALRDFGDSADPQVLQVIADFGWDYLQRARAH
jgi:hypothetical protein